MSKVDWNIAIEAAAVVVEDNASHMWGAQDAVVAAAHIAEQIRKLKVEEIDQQVSPPILGAAGDEALYLPANAEPWDDACNVEALRAPYCLQRDHVDGKGARVIRSLFQRR